MDDEQGNKVVSAWCTATTALLIRAAADKKGVSVSKWSASQLRDAAAADLMERNAKRVGQ